MAKKNEGKDSKKPVSVQLESQDDIGYVTGRRDPQEQEKQVKTPAPRRQPHKAKDSSRGERRQ